MSDEDSVTIQICRGPPKCAGRDDPWNCRLCILMDPDDPDFDARLEREMKGN